MSILNCINFYGYIEIIESLTVRLLANSVDIVDAIKFRTVKLHWSAFW